MPCISFFCWHSCFFSSSSFTHSGRASVSKGEQNTRNIRNLVLLAVLFLEIWIISFINRSCRLVSESMTRYERTYQRVIGKGWVLDILLFDIFFMSSNSIFEMLFGLSNITFRTILTIHFVHGVNSVHGTNSRLEIGKQGGGVARYFVSGGNTFLS